MTEEDVAAWNLVLQKLSTSGAGITTSSCETLVVPGLPRPVRIAFLADNASADQAADAANRSVKSRLATLPNVQTSACSCQSLFHCVTWQEPACELILVAVIGASRQLHAAVAAFMVGWQGKGAPRARVIPALLPGLSHQQVFSGAAVSLSRLNAAIWLGDSERLADIAVDAALGRRPGVFLSYLRSEAREVADQLFEGLGQRGYRVFLDRFTGTAGRPFPEELAEEMANKAVLVLLETASLSQSQWTLWELAFARRYRIGVVALTFPRVGPLQRVAARKLVRPRLNGELSSSDLNDAVAFIGHEHARASLRRRAFYEGLVGAAAASRSGHIRVGRSGILELYDSIAQPKADILPCGRPGQLADARALHEGSQMNSKLLIGQHQHLSPPNRADLDWLVKQVGIDLVGPSDAVRTVQKLC